MPRSEILLQCSCLHYNGAVHSIMELNFRSTFGVTVNKTKMQACALCMTIETMLSVTISLSIQCDLKKVAPPKLFAVFSLLVNLCNWKLSWLLPKHILCLHQFWSIYLNICVKCIIFTGDPSNFKNSIYLLRKAWIFRKNTSHIKCHLIKYDNKYLLH